MKDAPLLMADPAPPGTSSATPAKPGRSRPAHLPLLAILATYLLLALAYGVATPILEAGDENWHEAVVWRIAAGHGLPVLNPAEAHKVLLPVQEAGQPPLYYLLAAAATFWLQPPDPAAVMLPSPNAAIGQPDRSAWNKNLFVHGSGESFPWHGLALAVHLQRLLSTVLGGITVVTVYALARLALPRQTAAPILAAAFVAFNPMFLFISAAVDNDALAIALSSVALLLLAQTLQRGPATRAALLTGLTLGLATLAKLSAAAVTLPAMVVVLGPPLRSRKFRQAARRLLALAVPALVIAGWWFLRNWALYGDPLGLAMFVRVAGGRPQPLTPETLLSEAPSLWDGFWGVFGIFDILLPAGYYRGARVLLALAGLGLLLCAIRTVAARKGASNRRASPVSGGIIALLAGWLVLEAILLVRWTASTEASSGRLLFPALGSVAVLTALGLTTLAGRWRGFVSAGLAILMALGSALAIPLAILPAYAAPAFVPAAMLHPEIPLGYRYGNLELVGASLPAGPLTPGGTLPVTLFWATVGPIQENDVVSIQLFGPAGVRVENPLHRTDAFPGGGKILTSQWPVGMGLVDQTPVQLRADVAQPSLVHIEVFVYPNGRQTQPLPVETAGGQRLHVPEIGRLVYGHAPAQGPSVAPVATFGGQIALDAVTLPATAPAGGNLTVGLRWQALTAPAGSYTVFVHVGPPNQPPLAQHDQQPLAGALPTTDWVPGEIVNDHSIAPLPATLAPGAYDIYVGLYLPATGARLPASGGGEQVKIGVIHVTPGGR